MKPTTFKYKHKILWGILGVGSGHTYRQLPLIEHFLKNSQIIIFASKNAYTFYSKKYEHQPNVRVLRVAPPYYPDSSSGIDFAQVEKLPINTTEDILAINTRALAQAQKIMGKPDLVISDYELISAMYAYAQNSPLITIDQQSKYLYGDFPRVIKGLNYLGEDARLRMFFPKADMRIACSFFRMERRTNFSANVMICPPILRERIIHMKRTPKQDTILVYLSARGNYKKFIQTLNDYNKNHSVTFHIFAEGITKLPLSNKHIITYEPQEEKFLELLAKCSGIICTSGHTLVSEAIYLGVPTLLLPRMQYEAHLVSQIIGKNKFGIACDHFSKKPLLKFLNNLELYAENIRTDKKILIRTSGQEKIIKLIEQKLTTSL